MLQRISGMYFKEKEDDLYCSYHKDIIYSNLSIKEKIENDVFSLEPVYINRRINTYILSYKYIAKKREEVGNTLNPVAHKEIVQQIIACLTIWFKGIFITDMNYLEKLLRDTSSTTDDLLYPKKVCPFMFDKEKEQEKDWQFEIKEFNMFFKKLLGLNQQTYKKIITSINQFYNSSLLINLDIDLAYTSFVAIIEALTQKLDEYQSKWEDYYEECRTKLDLLFEEIDRNKADDIKSTLLEFSHNKLANRYYNFCSNIVEIDYYTTDAVNIKHPCNERQLSKAIKNSYNLRSGYIHELKKLPQQFSWTYELEVCSLENNIYFTLQGIIRFTRYVICKLILKSEKVELNDQVYDDTEPGVFYVPVIEYVHPNHWIEDKSMFSLQTSIKYLNGLLEIYAENLIANKKVLPHLKEVCGEIEKLIKGISGNEKKLPLVVFYKLYNDKIISESKNENSDSFNKLYDELLKIPSIVTMSYYLTFGIDFPWDIETSINLFNEYDKKFNRKNSVRLPVLHESILLIQIINNYVDKEDEKYEYYLTKLIGIHPGNKFLSEFYAKYKTNLTKETLTIEKIYE